MDSAQNAQTHLLGPLSRAGLGEGSVVKFDLPARIILLILLLGLVIFFVVALSSNGFPHLPTLKPGPYPII